MPQMPQVMLEEEKLNVVEELKKKIPELYSNMVYAENNKKELEKPLKETLLQLYLLTIQASFVNTNDNNMPEAIIKQGLEALHWQDNNKLNNYVESMRPVIIKEGFTQYLNEFTNNVWVNTKQLSGIQFKTCIQYPVWFLIQYAQNCSTHLSLCSFNALETIGIYPDENNQITNPNWFYSDKREDDIHNPITDQLTKIYDLLNEARLDDEQLGICIDLLNHQTFLDCFFVKEFNSVNFLGQYYLAKDIDLFTFALLTLGRIEPTHTNLVKKLAEFIVELLDKALSTLQPKVNQSANEIKNMIEKSEFFPTVFKIIYLCIELDANFDIHAKQKGGLTPLDENLQENFPTIRSRLWKYAGAKLMKTLFAEHLHTLIVMDSNFLNNSNTEHYIKSCFHNAVLKFDNALKDKTRPPALKILVDKALENCEKAEQSKFATEFLKHTFFDMHYGFYNLAFNLPQENDEQHKDFILKGFTVYEKILRKLIKKADKDDLAVILLELADRINKDIKTGKREEAHHTAMQLAMLLNATSRTAWENFSPETQKTLSASETSTLESRVQKDIKWALRMALTTHILPALGKYASETFYYKKGGKVFNTLGKPEGLTTGPKTGFESALMIILNIERENTMKLAFLNKFTPKASGKKPTHAVNKLIEHAPKCGYDMFSKENFPLPQDKNNKDAEGSLWTVLAQHNQ